MNVNAEILFDLPMIQRGQRILQALHRAAAPGRVSITRRYQGNHPVLVLYGAGSEYRQGAIARHKANGGRVVMMDLGYWDRDHRMRMSVDEHHPTAAHFAIDPPAGVERWIPQLREDWDPHGPVLLIGNGKKARAHLGMTPLEWEVRKLAELRARFPERTVYYRPKGKKNGEEDIGAPMRHAMTIEDAIKRCALVVCKHSNVAVDACIAGVPVECEDGAAFHLYRHGANPSREQRTAFLKRLAWWQWHYNEAGACWAWIERVLA